MRRFLVAAATACCAALAWSSPSQGREIDLLLSCDGTYNGTKTTGDLWEIYLFVNGKRDFEIAIRRRFAGATDSQHATAFRIYNTASSVWTLDDWQSYGTIDTVSGTMEMRFDDPGAKGAYRATCQPVRKKF